MTERITEDRVYGGNAYPDCENSEKFIPMFGTGVCKALENADGCASNGTYWCSVAIRHNKCPLGKE